MRSRRQRILIALCVLAFVAIPIGIVYQRSLHHAQLGKSRAKLRSHLQILAMHAGTNGDALPSAQRWPDVIAQSGMFFDGLMESEYRDAPGDAYVYVEGVEFSAPDQILVYESTGHWREGVLTGFADGRVEMIPHGEFEHLLADQLDQP